MFVLGFHIIAIGILVVFVWAIAYGMGKRAGERRARRQLGAESPGSAGAPDKAGS